MTSESNKPARDAGRSPVGTGTPRTGTGTGTPPADVAGQGDAMRQGGAAHQQVPRQAGTSDAARYRRSRPRGAVIGFRILAAVLMMVSGVWGFFEGLAAIIRGSFYVVSRDYAYGMSAAAWGWIHLILAVMIGVAGLAVLLDMLWARFTGVVMAGLIMLANFLYIPYYPFWSIVVIALNVVIIWALLTPPRDYA